jgi:hypothetical protein
MRPPDAAGRYGVHLTPAGGLRARPDGPGSGLQALRSHPRRYQGLLHPLIAHQPFEVNEVPTEGSPSGVKNSWVSSSWTNPSPPNPTSIE